MKQRPSATGVRVFFLNRFFHPDHSATSQMLSGIAFGLRDEGVPVHVVTSRLRYDSPELLPSAETINGVHVHRIRTTRFGRANLLGRALDYATFYLAAMAALLMNVRRGDIVIAKTDPPMLSVVVAPIARLRGARTVNWLQDIFPEIARELGAFGAKPRSLPYALLCKLRNRSLQGARNVVLGSRMADRVHAMGVLRENIHVIENFADGSLIRPAPTAGNALRERLGIEERFVVGYSGNLGRAHEYATMLRAMEILQSRDEIAWLFIGGGALYGNLKTEVLRRELPNVHFLPYQPETELSRSLAAADVHLVSLLPAVEGLVVPSKFYGICAAGRPCVFIGDPGGEIAEQIRRFRCGLAVPQGDGELLARIVARLDEHRSWGDAMGRRARRAFERKFDKSHSVGKWKQLIDDVSANPP